MKRLLQLWSFSLLLLVGEVPSYAQFASISHRLTYSAPSLKTISEDGQMYSEISLDNLFNRGDEVGTPMLPVQRLTFGVPRGAYDFVVTVQGKMAQTQTLKYPIRPQPEEVPIGSEANEKEPLSVLSWKSEQILPRTRVDYYRDCKILQVDFHPLLYSTESQTLTSYGELDVQVSWKESATEARKATYQCWMEKPYLEEMIDNYAQYMQYEGATKGRAKGSTKTPPSTLPSTCEYLIITTPDLYDSFKKLARWKRKKGLDAKIVLVGDILQAYKHHSIPDGFNDMQEKIRFYLQDLLSSSNGKFQYLVLGGSVEKIPARCCPYQRASEVSNIYTDFYYTNLHSPWSQTTFDAKINNGDIAVGRVSAQVSSEVDNWFNKQYLYEVDPGRGDPSYLGRGFCSEADEMQDSNYARDSFACPSSKWKGLLKIIGEEGGCNTSYTPEFPTGKYIVDEISKGYGLVSIMGHGSHQGIAVATLGFNNKQEVSQGSRVVYSTPEHSFESTAVPEVGNTFMDLTNIDKPSINFSVSCNNAQLIRTNGVRNLAEAFTVLSLGGGPVFVGNSDVGLLFASDWLFEVQFKSMHLPIGIAINEGKIKGINPLLTFSQVIYGCPETKLWLKTPNRLHFSINRFAKTIEISGEDLRGARVTIYKQHEGELGEIHQIYDVGAKQTLRIQDLPSSDYEITILKDGFLPVTIPLPTYVQNQTVADGLQIDAYEVYVGENVTDWINPGKVTFKPFSNSTINYGGKVVLDRGTTIERGAKVVIKNKN